MDGATYSSSHESNDRDGHWLEQRARVLSKRQLVVAHKEIVTDEVLDKTILIWPTALRRRQCQRRDKCAMAQCRHTSIISFPFVPPQKMVLNVKEPQVSRAFTRVFMASIGATELSS